jgi:hypothetical protein
MVAVTELGSYGAIYALQRRLDEPIRRRADIYAEQTSRLRRLLANDRRELIDPVLGWRYRPGYTSATDAVTIQGLRGRRLYPERARPGVTRVAAFGDSFVYGNEVSDSDSWCAIVERSAPAIEVLNYGVGGYGIDQAYLRYRLEGHTLSPRIVLIGFVPDDLRRVVNVYRRFLSSYDLPLAKPRYVLDRSGDLALVPAVSVTRYAVYLERADAVRELGRHDQWYEPLIYDNPFWDWSATVRLGTSTWIRARRRFLDVDRLERDGRFNASSAAFTIQLKLFERFAHDVRESGAIAVIVFFPDRPALEGQTPVYQPLLNATRQLGLRTIDLTSAMRAAARGHVAHLFMPGGHYSPAGNAVVADTLIGTIRNLQPLGQPPSHHYDGQASDDAGTDLVVGRFEKAHETRKPHEGYGEQYRLIFGQQPGVIQ